MEYIEDLLEQLNTLFLISEHFKSDLRPMLKEVDYGNFKVLQSLKGKAKKAWQLLQGYITFSMIDLKGKEIIVRIYVPGQILTDFPSLFLSEPSTVIIKSDSRIKVLELNKKDFLKLDKYPETDKLVQRILLQEQHMEATRAMLLVLSDLEKVRTFAVYYPIDEISNETAASFLHMQLSNYIELKMSYQRSAFVASGKDSRASYSIYKNTTEMAYAIKAYIEEHFTDPDIGDTLKISRQFNTTRKTLTRAFTGTFQVTVYKLILHLRMNLAHTLIKEGISVKDASSRAGYTNVHNFNRNYKKYFGFRPGNRSSNL